MKELKADSTKKWYVIHYQLTNELRLIKGFNTAYKRMQWDKPAPTLTQNFQFEASDNKIHPAQNRVLSIYEGLKIQTITDYNYNFIIKNKLPLKSIMQEIIGESVPPKLIEIISKKIIEIDDGNVKIEQYQLDFKQETIKN